MSQNERSFDRMSRELRPRLVGYCTKMLGDAAAAEDVAQETLLRAWERRALLDPSRDPAPWLFTVARNLCVEAMRGRARMITVAALPDRPGNDDGPHERVEAAEEAVHVRRALDDMPERQRTLLLMRDVNRAAYQDLAKEFGVSEPAARVMLFRARRMLRDRFVAAAGVLAAFGAALRSSLQRARRLTQWAHASSTSEAMLSNVAAIGIALASTLTLTAPGASFDTRDATATASVERGRAPRTTSLPLLTARPPTVAPGEPTPTVAVDPEAGAHIETPVPTSDGREGRAWIAGWRDRSSERSTVLTTAEDACATVCAVAWKR